MGLQKLRPSSLSFPLFSVTETLEDLMKSDAKFQKILETKIKNAVRKALEDFLEHRKLAKQATLHRYFLENPLRPHKQKN